MARLTKFSQIDGNRGNAYEIVYDDERHLMISYETLVAGKHPELGWLVTNSYHSKSTDKQIANYFLNNNSRVTRVSQSILEDLLF